MIKTRCAHLPTEIALENMTKEQLLEFVRQELWHKVETRRLAAVIWKVESDAHLKHEEYLTDVLRKLNVAGQFVPGWTEYRKATIASANEWKRINEFYKKHLDSA